MVDAGGKLLFPGVVDVHQHWGIYNELGEDAVSESRAAHRAESPPGSPTSAPVRTT